jgi:hypothetical protein
MNEHFFKALGDGWLGTAIIGVLTFVFGWITRRPAEMAAVITAVDGRVETLFDALEKRARAAEERCAALEAKQLADRQLCDRELADMREEIRKAMTGPPASY